MSTRIPKRGAVYYVQQAVPLDLRDVLGANQIWKSLGTKDFEEAKTLHLKAKIAFRDQFKRLREERAARDAYSSTGAPRPSPLTPQRLAAQQRAQEEWERENREFWDANPLPDYDDLSPEDQRIRDAVEAARDRWEISQREEREFARQERRVEAAAKPPGAVSAKVQDTVLSAVVDRWSKNQKNQKTIDRMTQVVTWFENDMGRVPVEEITADIVLNWSEKLLKRTTSLSLTASASRFSSRG